MPEDEDLDLSRAQDRQALSDFNRSRRLINMRGKLPCGHWGNWKMNRREYDAWVNAGGPLTPLIGMPEACEKCQLTAPLLWPGAKPIDPEAKGNKPTLRIVTSQRRKKPGES